MHKCRWLLLLLLAACAETDGCGDTEFAYPRGDDPETRVTPRLMRMRMSEWGLNHIASTFPSIIRDVCERGDGECTMDPQNPNVARFEFGGPGESMRAGSWFAIDLNSLDNNVRGDLLADQDGLRIKAACDAEDLGLLPDCNKPVTGQAHFVFHTSGLGTSAVCRLEDSSPPEPGVELHSLAFTIRPRIIQGDNGPELDLSDVEVDPVDMVLRLDSDPVNSDPDCGTGCSFTCQSLDSVNVLAPLLAGTLADTIAGLLIDVFSDELNEVPLELEGSLDTEAMTGLGNPDANPVGYLLTPTANTPDVSGVAGALGMNFDFDAGFVGERHPCVPTYARLASSWDLQAAPDFDGLVLAPIPGLGSCTDDSECGDNGLCRQDICQAFEPFDAAMLVGDSLINRALFEMFDSGGLCLHLGGDGFADLTSGFFEPNMEGYSLIIDGLDYLGPGVNPVDLVMVPPLPPLVRYGTGEGEGEDRDSHIQFLWPEVVMEVYPLSDDSRVRAVAFQVDLSLKITVEFADDGNILLAVDKVGLENMNEIYNELVAPFDPASLGELIEAALPLALGSEPIDLGITEAIGDLPFVPKLRQITRTGLRGEYLSIYMRFCTPEDIEDDTNPVCYNPCRGLGEDACGGLDDCSWGEDRCAQRALSGNWLAAQAVGPANSGKVQVQVNTDIADSVEVAYRMAAGGPWFSFRRPQADGTFLLEHPALRIAGHHTMEVVVRDPTRPGQWSAPVDLDVWVDGAAPVLRAWRHGDEILVWADDDVTPVDRLSLRGRATTDTGVREIPWQAVGAVTAAPWETVELWIRDESGRESQPVVVVGIAEPMGPSEALPPAGAGCQGAPLGIWPLPLLLLRRRRPSKS